MENTNENKQTIIMENKNKPLVKTGDENPVNRTSELNVQELLDNNRKGLLSDNDLKMILGRQSVDGQLELMKEESN